MCAGSETVRRTDTLKRNSCKQVDVVRVYSLCNLLRITVQLEVNVNYSYRAESVRESSISKEIVVTVHVDLFLALQQTH